MFSGVFSSGGGIRNTAQNAGKMPDSSEGGAESGAWGCLSGANWSEIRGLIARCDELPEDVRGRLVALGDKSVAGAVECPAE